MLALPAILLVNDQVKVIEVRLRGSCFLSHVSRQDPVAMEALPAGWSIPEFEGSICVVISNVQRSFPSRSKTAKTGRRAPVTWSR